MSNKRKIITPQDALDNFKAVLDGVKRKDPIDPELLKLAKGVTLMTDTPNIDEVRAAGTLGLNKTLMAQNRVMRRALQMVIDADENEELDCMDMSVIYEARDI